MTMRRAPDRPIPSLAPIYAFGISSCIGTFSHLYAGISTYVAIGVPAFVTVAVSLAAVACARAPYRAVVCKEESKARVRDAVIDGTITADDANTILNGEDPSITDELSSKRLRKVKTAQKRVLWRRRMGR